MEQIINIQHQAAQDEQIDRYLRNLMTEEEEKAFEAALQTDASLRSRARFIARTIKAMKEADAHEEEAKAQTAYEWRMVARNPMATTRKGKKK